MLVKSIDTLWSATKNIKSFTGLLKFLNDSPIVGRVSIVKWGVLYYVTVGTRKRNILIQIDIPAKTVDFTARVDDPETDHKYKILGSHDKRFNRVGVPALIDWLNKLN